MTVIPITCDNCGAKYKLPPTFKGAQAKCQKCGSVIDVASQRAAAGDGDEKPAAAARPAAARPAVDRSKSRPTTSARKTARSDTTTDKPARGASSRKQRGANADAGDDDARPGRRGREPKQASKMPLILSGVGIVVIAIAALVFFSDGDKPQQQDTATAGDTTTPNGKDDTGKQTAEASAAKDATGDDAATGAAPATDTPAADTSGTGDAAAGDTAADDSGAEAPAAAAAEPAAPAGPAPSEEDRRTKPWLFQPNAAQTMDQVPLAAEINGEVSWPEAISDDSKAAVRGFAGKLDKYGGRPHIKAKEQLTDAGWPALYAILEKLRELDYRQNEDAQFGFELNRLIQDITGGLNARYAAVDPGEQMHPSKAQWNTKTVGAWMKMFAEWSSEEQFQETRKRLLTEKKG